MKKVNVIFGFLLLLFIWSCQQEAKLPILGEKVIDEATGELKDYQTPLFSLTNQSDQIISSQDLSGKIQVVDFFFTSCPSICPAMTKHLKLVQEAFEGEERVHIISYSIDPQKDTPQKLNRYAQTYQINPQQWTLLTGEQDEILELSKDYKVRAFEEEFAGERNLIHDGTFVLVDTQRRIRGYYNGLEKEDTERLIKDIRKLLKE